MSSWKYYRCYTISYLDRVTGVYKYEQSCTLVYIINDERTRTAVATEHDIFRERILD